MLKKYGWAINAIVVSGFPIADSDTFFCRNQAHRLFANHGQCLASRWITSPIVLHQGLFGQDFYQGFH